MNHLGGLRRTDARPTGEHRGEFSSSVLLIVFSSPNRRSVLCILVLPYPSKWKRCCYACVPLKADIAHLSPLQMIRNGAILTDLGQGSGPGLDLWHVFNRKDLVSPVARRLLLLRPSPLLLSKSNKMWVWSRCHWVLGQPHHRVHVPWLPTHLSSCGCQWLPQRWSIPQWLVWLVWAESPWPGLEWAG